MEKMSLEIIRSIFRLVEERDALLEELKSTKELLEGAVSAQETLQKRREKENLCVVCGRRDAGEGRMVCFECEKRSGLF